MRTFQQSVRSAPEYKASRIPGGRQFSARRKSPRVGTGDYRARIRSGRPHSAPLPTVPRFQASSARGSPEASAEVPEDDFDPSPVLAADPSAEEPAAPPLFPAASARTSLTSRPSDVLGAISLRSSLTTNVQKTAATTAGGISADKTSPIRRTPFLVVTLCSNYPTERVGRPPRRPRRGSGDRPCETRD